MLLGLLTGCAPKPATPQRLVYGLTLAPSGIDPHINSSSELGIPLTSVYDTLVYQDPATRALALESGQAQIMGEVPPQDVDRLTSSGKFQLIAVPIPGQPLQLFLNVHRAPTDDLRVRQALIYATDRATIVKAILNASALTFLGIGAPPGTPEWGAMLHEGRLYVHEAPWVAAASGTLLTLTVLAVNLIGDGLRDAIDPRLRV